MAPPPLFVLDWGAAGCMCAFRSFAGIGRAAIEIESVEVKTKKTNYAFEAGLNKTPFASLLIYFGVPLTHCLLLPLNARRQRAHQSNPASSSDLHRRNNKCVCPLYTYSFFFIFFYERASFFFLHFAVFLFLYTLSQQLFVQSPPSHRHSVINQSINQSIRRARPGTGRGAAPPASGASPGPPPAPSPKTPGSARRRARGAATRR
jgi:hypothetical protein